MSKCTLREYNSSLVQRARWPVNSRKILPKALSVPEHPFRLICININGANAKVLRESFFQNVSKTCSVSARAKGRGLPSVPAKICAAALLAVHGATVPFLGKRLLYFTAWKLTPGRYRRQVHWVVNAKHYFYPGWTLILLFSASQPYVFIYYYYFLA